MKRYDSSNSSEGAAVPGVTLGEVDGAGDPDDQDEAERDQRVQGPGNEAADDQAHLSSPPGLAEPRGGRRVLQRLRCCCCCHNVSSQKPELRSSDTVKMPEARRWIAVASAAASSSRAIRASTIAR